MTRAFGLALLAVFAIAALALVVVIIALAWRRRRAESAGTFDLDAQIGRVQKFSGFDKRQGTHARHLALRHERERRQLEARRLPTRSTDGADVVDITRRAR